VTAVINLAGKSAGPEMKGFCPFLKGITSGGGLSFQKATQSLLYAARSHAAWIAKRHPLAL
jgi:hypothetical protein